MIFCIITHVQHSVYNEKYFGYAPYINEMNIWLKHVDKLIVVAPLKKYQKSEIQSYYNHPNIVFCAVPSFSLTSLKDILHTIFSLPKLVFTIYKAMKMSDYIHLRCPGNMGLLGSILQILFPKKNKTAKYAGNWDKNSKQPISYKIQKWILSSIFLTKNMQVLVYGEWENQTKNIKPFFTATYTNLEKVTVDDKSFNNDINFIFVGSLTSGKRPLYAIQLVVKLHQFGLNVNLSLYGEGTEITSLTNYIKLNNLDNFIFLKGNISREVLISIYTNSHFLILPSKSEGWPKVIAEAMFWKCLPVATKVSCVGTMLDRENRGLIINLDLNEDVKKLEKLINDSQTYQLKINNGFNWSRNYTIDKFEVEIKKLLSQ